MRTSKHTCINYSANTCRDARVRFQTWHHYSDLQNWSAYLFTISDILDPYVMESLLLGNICQLKTFNCQSKLMEGSEVRSVDTRIFRMVESY